jgi:AcrR family transcriptional regulator
MMDAVAHIRHGTETPNQLGRQQQIIDAARDVLAREGLAGCTARSVADASPLTKSAVHYYFRDSEEIIDRAMSAHLDAMLASLRQVAAAEADPVRRLWRVVDAYLDVFAGNPHAARLWFEYWIALSRRAAAGPVAGNWTGSGSCCVSCWPGQVTHGPGRPPTPSCRGCSARSSSRT